MIRLQFNKASWFLNRNGFEKNLICIILRKRVALGISSSFICIKIFNCCVFNSISCHFLLAELTVCPYRELQLCDWWQLGIWSQTSAIENWPLGDIQTLFLLQNIILERLTISGFYIYFFLNWFPISLLQLRVFLLMDHVIVCNMTKKNGRRFRGRREK